MKNKIKIIYVMPTLGVGGAEQIILTLCKKLNKDKFEIKAVTLGEKGLIGKEIEQLGIEVISLENNQKFSFFNAYIIISSLVKIFKKFKPDIVHTQLWSADFYGRFAAIISKIPVRIVTIQNTSHAEKIKHRLIDYLFSFFTNKIIAISNAVKKYILLRERIPSKKIQIIYDRIDYERYSSGKNAENLRAEFNFNKEDFILISIGSMRSEQKGYEYLLNALKIILENRKHKNIRLLIVGEGILENELKELAKQLSISDYVYFTGLRQDIPDLLNISDIFVLASLWEGLGLVILEAMAAKLPVVSTAIGPIDEVVVNGETGILVPPRNSQSLAKAIEYLLDNPDKRKEYGIKGQERVKKYFSDERMVKEYENLYIQELRKKKQYENA